MLAGQIIPGSFLLNAFNVLVKKQFYPYLQGDTWSSPAPNSHNNYRDPVATRTSSVDRIQTLVRPYGDVQDRFGTTSGSAGRTGV
jgi:hypothetical protein